MHSLYMYYYYIIMQTDSAVPHYNQYFIDESALWGQILLIKKAEMLAMYKVTLAMSIASKCMHVWNMTGHH